MVNIQRKFYDWGFNLIPQSDQLNACLIQEKVYKSNQTKWMIIKMKQFQLQQVKFPKAQIHAETSQSVLDPSKPKSTAQSEMIRIIIAMLIALFIYNESQETTINYNEIIKNQKMFLVKNIRGVIPTLSGNTYKLQDHWKVVHFQNYHQNDSQMFTNYTLLFNSTHLSVENTYCNSKLVYEWKNYSYNIDLVLINQNTGPMIVTTINKTTNEANSSIQNSAQNVRTLTEPPILNTQKQFAKDEIDDNMMQVSKLSETLTTQQQSLQKKCNQNIVQFKQLILYTSVWTISGLNLYLLIQDAHMDEDFYMILRPVS